MIAKRAVMPIERFSRFWLNFGIQPFLVAFCFGVRNAVC